MNSAGLTLIEILVALTVLAIGAASITGLQLATFRLSQLTRHNATLLHVADSELQNRLLGVATGEHCSALTEAELEGVDCKVEMTACAVSLAGFDCNDGAAGASRRVTVTASLENGQSVELSAVTRFRRSP